MFDRMYYPGSSPALAGTYIEVTESGEKAPGTDSVRIELDGSVLPAVSREGNRWRLKPLG